MPSGVHNAYIEQGADWRLVLTLTDTNGAPFDLTGHSGAAQIRESWRTSTVLAQITVSFSIPRASGEVVLSLSSAATKLLPTAGIRYQETANYVWEFSLTTPTGEVLRVLNGDASVSPGGVY
jgi:hypothetical protein